MSDETLLSMDEGALRKLLEITSDLAERRQIRSAIRELRRQELERDEEALASKRFRTERQENKENWLRSQQLEEEQKQKQSLDVLSGKLETIQDVDELMTLLRGASEYEERKLIRAAIRKVRAEEIEAASLAGKSFHNRRDKDEKHESERLEENATDCGTCEVQDLAVQELIQAPMHELRSELHREAEQTDIPGASSGAVLFLDPVPLPLPSEASLSSFLESNTEGPEPREPYDSGSDTKPQSLSKEDSPCGTSGGEDRETLALPAGGALGETMQEQAETPAAERDAEQSEEACPRPLSTESIEAVLQTSEKEESPEESKVEVTPSPVVPETPVSLDAHRCNALQSTPGPAAVTDFQWEQPFHRSGSVRDRARKFSSEPLKQSGILSKPSKVENTSKTSRILQQQLLNPQSGEDLPVGTRSGVTGLGLQGGTRQAGDSRGGVKQTAKPTAFQPKSGTVWPPSQGLVSPKEAGNAVGRSQDCQWPGKRLTPARQPAESSKRSSAVSKEPSIQPSISSSSSSCSPLPPQAHSANSSASDAMKTLFTIEIKDGRSHPLRSHIVGTPGHQRAAELTLGLRSTPVRITTSSSVTPTSHGSGLRKMDAEVPERPQMAEPELSNGTEKEKVQTVAVQQRSCLSAEDLSKIEEEDVLDKLLDQTSDFEERRLIRAAMRELRQRKRELREKERDQRLQEAKTKAGNHTTESTSSQSATSADGSAVSRVTKTQRLVQSNDGSKSSRTTVESSYMKRSENGNTFVQTKSSFSSSSSKKVGSIFEREDESPGRASSVAALERRQAEKKKELMKAQSLPKTSASQARKAMIEKLEKESGSPANPAVSRVAVQRSSSFGVPNANSIKQMLLDWCRAKTRGYEHVDIQNFSSSWSDGMAFCALVHNFFPEAFDYAQLSPQDRRRNFEISFSAAETHAECPQLLDVEDMVRMREPDWKCVYTYIQEYYRCLVQKGLVKTKKS